MRAGILSLAGTTEPSLSSVFNGEFLEVKPLIKGSTWPQSEPPSVWRKVQGGDSRITQVSLFLMSRPEM